MKVARIPFEQTNAFSSFFLDYIQNKKSLQPFYNRFPALENFSGQMREKSGSYSQPLREILCAILADQYSGFQISPFTKSNLELLGKSTTFTITTGHQLNLFTGPLYFIYKIITVINSCRRLKEEFPKNNFVPVFWMASEDHDFEEISYFRLYGKKYKWETNQRGAVGRFSTRDLGPLLDQVPGKPGLFQEAYTSQPTLSKAVRHYVNELFGKDGLIIVDGDDRQLKKSFSSIMRDDLFNHTAKTKIDSTNLSLHDLKYQTQVNAREINLFYLEEQTRIRIEKKGERFAMVDTPNSFSADEMEIIIRGQPEKLSPNVVLRPLYQEMILPNLAYVGGPAELVYWLQLKGVFDHYKITLPILLPRNFALVIDPSNGKKLGKTKIKVNELFQEKDQLINLFVKKHAKHKVALNGEKDAIAGYFDVIRKNAEQLDHSLGAVVGAAAKKTFNSLERIEQKLVKAEKRKQAETLQQVTSLKDNLFPDGSLQERTDNFLNFYQQNPSFINDLQKSFDPFDFRFYVISY